MFSILGYPGDTVIFTFLGFMSDTIEVRYDEKLKYYANDIFLKKDTILLREVEIYPWATWEEFKEAFVNLEVSSPDIENAKNNIKIILESIEADLDIPPSAGINYRVTMNEIYNERMKYRFQPQYISILNPFAWAKFFEALQNGDFKTDKN
jgi:hypothetical protein